MSSIGGSSWLRRQKLLLALACYCCLLAQANSLWARSETIDDIDGLNRKICGLRRPGPYGKRSTRQDIGPRMSAGWDADRGEFPWSVWINIDFQDKGGSFRTVCTGSIINHNLILTAAHCLTEDGLEPFKVTVFADMVRIAENSSAQIYEGEKFCRARGWKGKDVHPREDLGLIKLKSSIRYNNDVRPICIPSLRDSEPPRFDRASCLFSGYGRTDYSKERPYWKEVLRGMPMEPCPDSFLETIDYDENELCLESADKKHYPGNGCKGDSGGGLACLDERIDGEQNYLAGVFSLGPRVCRYGETMYGLFASTWDLRKAFLEIYDRCGK